MQLRQRICKEKKEPFTEPLIFRREAEREGDPIKDMEKEQLER